ncbi:MAG: hypothetical protein IPI91_16410 [Flavobacteriales bacterium]|nr:hypothetical protein [Flavobacteriales bacterium]
MNVPADELGGYLELRVALEQSAARWLWTWLGALCLFVTGMGNIRDVIPFPRTPGVRSSKLLDSSANRTKGGFVYNSSAEDLPSTLVVTCNRILAGVHEAEALQKAARDRKRSPSRRSSWTSSVTWQEAMRRTVQQGHI